jgi:PEP-CTERM motif
MGKKLPENPNNFRIDRSLAEHLTLTTMKKAIYVSALIAAALMLPSPSKADSFVWSTNGGSTETTLSSFSMVQGKNEFEIQVPSSSPLALQLFIDSLLKFKRGFPQITIEEFANVDGSGELEGTSEFDGDSIIGFKFGPVDTFYFSFKSDPVSGPVPEPSSLLMLGSGIAGLGLLKRRFA